MARSTAYIGSGGALVYDCPPGV